MNAVRQAWLILSIALVVPVTRWLLQPCDLQTVVPEPEGLGGRLRALPPSWPLTADDHRRFIQDGVVLIKNAVGDPVALEMLAKAMWEGGFWPHNMTLTNLWVVNGGLRALIRDSAMGPLAASAMGAPSVRIASSASWYKERVRAPGPSAKWHVDDQLTASTNEHVAESRLATVWVALTDAPESLEFMLGSHRIPHSCPYQVSPTLPDQDCLTEAYAANLTERIGKDARLVMSANAGDVVIMNGKMWHRGRSHLAGRLAVSLRFYWSDTRFERELTRDFGTFFYRRFMPKVCDLMSGPLFPVIFPTDKSTVDSSEWPLLITWYDLLVARVVRTYYDLVAVVLGRFSFSACGG